MKDDAFERIAPLLSERSPHAPDTLAERVMQDIRPHRAVRTFHPAWAAAVLSSAAVLVFAVTFAFLRLRPAQVTVEISIVNRDAKAIHVVGDFNNWDPSAHPLTRTSENGVWRTKLKLSPGRYRYQLIIDNDRYIPDPRAREAVHDQFGGMNSILEL
ncbi:MAG: isoamylase early set domain-containing protein [Spirochaetota bacterium]